MNITAALEQKLRWGGQIAPTPHVFQDKKKPVSDRVNIKITSNKTEYLEVQKKLNSLITNDYNFFLGRMYFTSNGESQNTFVYQPTFDTLELKKDKGTDYVLSWKTN